MTQTEVKNVLDRLRELGYTIGFTTEQLLIRDFAKEEEAPDKNKLGGFRKSDPSTSRKAAMQHYPRSGSQRHKALIYIAAMSVNGRQGATYEDVQNATGINGVWKRLSELSEAGWIEIKGERMIEDTGSMGGVYFVTEKGLRWIRANEG